MQHDLTCLFLTVNRVPWMRFHNKKMLEAIGDYPLITISREPMDLPGIQMRQDGEQSHHNMFKHMLRGAKMAKTDYIGLIEDDILYSDDHFHLRPSLDAVGFNWNRWSLFTFGEPTYSFKRRICGGASILPRQLLIDALEERFAKHPNGIPHYLNGEIGYDIVDKNLGVTVRKSQILYSSTPVVQIHHIYGTPGMSHAAKQGDAVEHEKRATRKRMGMKRAYDIPHWGKSAELIKHFV